MAICIPCDPCGIAAYPTPIMDLTKPAEFAGKLTGESGKRGEYNQQQRLATDKENSTSFIGKDALNKVKDLLNGADGLFSSDSPMSALRGLK